MSKGKLQRDDENQTRCWTATEGHIWMNDYFDDLPPGAAAAAGFTVQSVPCVFGRLFHA
jgi:hypothetical protein